VFDPDDFDRSVQALMARHEGSDCFMGAPPANGNDDPNVKVPIAVAPGYVYLYFPNDNGRVVESGIELLLPPTEYGHDDTIVHYVPFVNHGTGVAGFLVVGMGEFEYIYLRPSDNADDGRGCLYVYQGPTTVPADDTALNYYLMKKIPEGAQ
jgi:hypothetical protein